MLVVVQLLFLNSAVADSPAAEERYGKEGKPPQQQQQQQQQQRELAIQLPTELYPRCPWLSEGVVGAARKSPLIRTLVRRTRLAAPFGPGTWPEPFRLSVDKTKEDKKNDDGSGGLHNNNRKQQQFGWKGAIVLSATVRIDKKAAAKWLPKSLLRVANDTATVFIAW